MFVHSSQKKYWTFENEAAINEKRKEQNRKYIEKYGANIDNAEEFFLSPLEEIILFKYYEIKLSEFCASFDPSMPKNVVATSFQYFKRFFINNSVMDFHPKDILHTCVYLATKVEEFNIPIQHFVANIKDDQAKVTDMILSNELLLMQQLNYYLTIHSAFRPAYGLVLDLNIRSDTREATRLLKAAESFIESTFLTEATLIYSPSQIALAAVLHAASIEKINLDQYVTETLLKNAREQLPTLIEAVRKIRIMVKRYAPPPLEEVERIEMKIEACRNPENNPDSAIYKEKMRRLLLDDDIEIHVTRPYDMAGITDTSMLNVSQ